MMIFLIFYFDDFKTLLLCMYNFLNINLSENTFLFTWVFFIQVWITVGKRAIWKKKVMCYAPVNMNEKRINIRNNFR